MPRDLQTPENTQDTQDTSEDSQKISKKSIKRWVNTPTDRFFVKAIKNNLYFEFKFLDNTSLEGIIKWFNKYNLAITTSDGSEYILLKHAIKYIVTIDKK